MKTLKKIIFLVSFFYSLNIISQQENILFEESFTNTNKWSASSGLSLPNQAFNTNQNNTFELYI